MEKNCHFMRIVAILLVLMLNSCDPYEENGMADKTLIIDGEIMYELVEITPGVIFSMGSNVDAEADEKPVHLVNISDPFMIGKYEVTEKFWEKIMEINLVNYTRGDDYPVQNVSWFECQDFISRLNTKLASELDGKKFALPTEAQWEYVAGQQCADYNNIYYYEGMAYSGSSTADDVAWFNFNSDGEKQKVGKKQKNQNNIYDMSGNVREWCQDWYGPYSEEYGWLNDPTGPAIGTKKVHRGGSWMCSANGCRVCDRDCDSPTQKIAHVGLRLVLQ